MADRKISDLTALTTPAAGDYLPIVDISEASAANKNKRITIEELLRGAPDGTAAAPSIAFESDPNTGIYSPGADAFGVVTGGTERLRITSAGLVGVGTSSVASLLHLASSGPVLTLQRSDSASPGAAINFTNNTGGVNWQVGTNQAVGGSAFEINSGNQSNNRFVITSGGLVGIGTSSPSTSLDVRGIISLGSSYLANAVIQKSAVPGGSYNLTITSGAGLTSESATTPTDALAGSVIKLVGGDPTTDAFGGGIQYFANGSTSPNGAGIGNQHVFYTRSAADTYTERLRIDASGRVGIGTTSPSSLLHLADAGDITVGTTTGTKIGTATTQKLGFYNATPVVQPTAVADATDAASVITQLNALLSRLRTLGIIAT